MSPSRRQPARNDKGTTGAAGGREAKPARAVRTATGRCGAIGTSRPTAKPHGWCARPRGEVARRVHGSPRRTGGAHAMGRQRSAGQRAGRLGGRSSRPTAMPHGRGARQGGVHRRGAATGRERGVAMARVMGLLIGQEAADGFTECDGLAGYAIGGVGVKIAGDISSGHKEIVGVLCHAAAEGNLEGLKFYISVVSGGFDVIHFFIESVDVD